MELVLREGVSFCDAGGRFVFLDLDRNRYFALGAESEQSFRSLLAREELAPADRERLVGLLDSGLLIPGGNGARLDPCATPPAPESDLLEEAAPFRPSALAHALYRLTLSAAALKLRPLPAILARLKRRKAKFNFYHGPNHAVLLEVAAAFNRSGLIAAPLDQCLPRSVAVAHALLDRDIAPLLVIGVRLRPFGAHCWVQQGSTAVNETVDNVRNFTPILVV